MDCAPFIRTKWILGAWIAVPLLLLITISMAVQGFHKQQTISYEQSRTLSHMIPEMQKEVGLSEGFLDTLRLKNNGSSSAQDLYINLINTAADETGFAIDTIYLDQETIDYELKTAKILITLKGNGTNRQTTEFLKRINDEDPMLCISTLRITPGNRTPGALSIEAELIKIYAE